MSARAKSNRDRFLDLLEDTLKSVEKKLDANTHITNKILVQAQKTNGRVNSLEEWRKTFKSGKPSGNVSNRILLLAVACIFIALIIVAGVLNIPLPKGILGE